MSETVQPRTQPRRARGLAHHVVASFTTRIRQRALKPGDKLPTESEIVAEFGVSRTVVREAISRLQAAGLVETRHGIGTFVREAPPKGPFRVDPNELATIMDLIPVLELRIGLETESAALAAARRSEAQLGEMRGALDDFVHDVEAGGDAVDADSRFHLQIALATGNGHFVELMNYLGTMVIPRTRVNTARLAKQGRSDYLVRVNHEHEDIYQAIARKDPEAARAAMRTHLANSCERLKRAHEGGPVEAA
jgi:GntR family transcriptional regulator, transcriptional repressor for pyruvate dehydrogenase complex